MNYKLAYNVYWTAERGLAQPLFLAISIVSFFHERKSERIESKSKTQNPNLVRLSESPSLLQDSLLSGWLIFLWWLLIELFIWLWWLLSCSPPLSWLFWLELLWCIWWIELFRVWLSAWLCWLRLNILWLCWLRSLACCCNNPWLL